MKQLKITSPQWANYTGSLGIVHFTNGVSDGLVPENVRRRLSIGMDMVEIDEDGNEAHKSNQLFTLKNILRRLRTKMALMVLETSRRFGTLSIGPYQC